MARQGRLARELKLMSKKARPGIFLGPVNDSLEVFEASITGVEGTPYESGVFKLEVTIPETYPFSAPLFKFVTQVYHPNIDAAGRICLKSLKPPPAGDWSPALMLIDVVQEIRMLLKHPNPDDSLMPDIAKQYVTDRELFDNTARDMTKKYAIPASAAAATKETETALANAEDTSDKKKQADEQAKSEQEDL